MAQPYSLFIPDRPVITIHLDDDELHCAEFGRIYNHDTEERDAHQPVSRSARLCVHRLTPMPPTQLFALDWLRQIKLAAKNCRFRGLVLVMLRCTTFNELRAGVSRTDVAAQVTGVDPATFMDVLTAPAMPRHAEMNVLAAAIVAAGLWLAPQGTVVYSCTPFCNGNIRSWSNQNYRPQAIYCPPSDEPQDDAAFTARDID